MSTIRFIMIGGFLGAGKTTTMGRLARAYARRGLRVGLVTNDQADNLVDTKSLEAQGFPVEEVAGACFCCKFDELVDKVNKLGSDNRPDVIVAEPVGSCTDLVATVVQPLRDIYRDQFKVTPYGVLFKPSHGLRILRNEPNAGFSPKAAYIFRKQLEEADAIVINRIDELALADVGHDAGDLLAPFPQRLGVVLVPGGVAHAVLEQLLPRLAQRLLQLDDRHVRELPAVLSSTHPPRPPRAQLPRQLPLRPSR